MTEPLAETGDASGPRASLVMFAWCDACAKQERMLTPRQAAAHCSVSPRTIYRWSAGGRLHHTRTPEGALLICYASLFGCEQDAGREGLAASARRGL